MTSAVEPFVERADVRTIVGGGVVLGALTALGVAMFAVASRALEGSAEVAVGSVVVLAGGALASHLPAHWVRPRHVDGIAWAALVGLLGSLTFTVVDTAVLRPLGIYHWTWDAIGGGSGFWYVPVWWMGSATLAWLGAWVVAVLARGGRDPRTVRAAAQTIVIALGVFAALVALTPLPAASAVMALAVGIALVLHLVLAALAVRR
jgi:hypothetical protein